MTDEQAEAEITYADRHADLDAGENGGAMTDADYYDRIHASAEPMTETAANATMRTCAWCEGNHPENIRYWFGVQYLYFCSDLCINEWGASA